MGTRGINRIKSASDIKGVKDIKGINDIKGIPGREQEESEEGPGQVKPHLEQLQKNMSGIRTNLQSGLSQTQEKLQGSIGTAKVTLNDNTRRARANIKKARRNVERVPMNLQKMLMQRAMRIVVNRMKRKIARSLKNAFDDVRSFLQTILEAILEMIRAVIAWTQNVLGKARQRGAGAAG